MAYNSQAHEIYYGGAAGGGKTALMIGLALTKHHKSLILRREATQLKNIVNDLERFMPKDSHKKTVGHGCEVNTPEGRVIEVNGCKDEKDKHNYQGQPHDLIAFDEAEAFTRTQFRFICGWNRSSDPNQICQVICGSNPPTTPEGRWIVTEFAPWLDSEFKGKPANPGELRWCTSIGDDLIWLDGPETFWHKGKKDCEHELAGYKCSKCGAEYIKPRSRTFIPAKLEDNPILSATDYGAQLQKMPEPLRSIMLYGDFTAGLDDNPWQVIPTQWVRQAQARWEETKPEGVKQSALGVDPARGGRDKTVIAKRYGRWFDRLKKFPGSSTPDGPSVATLVVREHEDEAIINVDVVGIGSSVYDYLRDQPFLKPLVKGVNNASASPRRDKSGKLKFVNTRAAAYWKLREDLDPSGDNPISLPPDNELLADLCAPRHVIQSSGIKVEPKDDIIERLGRSPDCADCVVLANWQTQPGSSGFQILSNRLPKYKGIKIAVVTLDELARIPFLDQKCLLVVFKDPNPKEVEVEVSSSSVRQTPEETKVTSGPEDSKGVQNLPCQTQTLPKHSILQLVDSKVIEFADLDPNDYQSSWGDPVEPWHLPIEDLVIDKQDAKGLWSFLTRKRQEVPDLYIFVDDKNRAMSAALGVADALRLSKKEQIWLPQREELAPEEAPNQNIYQLVRASRSSVI